MSDSDFKTKGSRIPTPHFDCPLLLNVLSHFLPMGSVHFSLRSQTKEQMEDPDWSVDAVINSVYETTSFLPGDDPDWAHFQTLFLPKAIFVPPSSSMDGKTEVMDLTSFVEYSKSALAASGMKRKGIVWMCVINTKGFLEVEIARRIEVFGTVAQVFSTFEDRISEEDSEPLTRGINSFQMINFAGKWKIVSMSWEYESEKLTVPSRYLS